MNTNPEPTRKTPDHLKRSIMRGSLWSFVAAAGRQGFGLLVFILLSRLLSPTDFGLMAMAIAGVELLCTLMMLGLVDIVVRKKDLVDTDTSTFFWLTASVGLVTSLLVFFAAKPIAQAYNQPLIAPMLQWLAVMPLLQSLLTVPQGMLLRNMQFKQMAMRTLWSSMGAGAASVAMALAGFGVYSLVFQRVSTLAIMLVSAWRLAGYRPRFLWSTEAARLHLPKGLSLVGSVFFNTASGRSLDIIAGFFLGPAAVGFYRIAGKLNDFIVQFLIDPIVKVALPSFAKVQDNTADLTRLYKRLTQICGLFSFPAFAGLAVVAPEVTTLVFGDKWAVSGELMRILCFASLGFTLNFFYKPLMVVLGRPQAVFKTQFMQFGLITLVTLATAKVSIHAVMMGFVAVNLFITVWNLLQVRRFLGLAPSEMGRAFAPPVISSLGMVAVLLATQQLLPSLNAPLVPSKAITLGIMIATGALTYAAIMLLVFRKYTMESLNVFKTLIKRKQ